MASEELDVDVGPNVTVHSDLEVDLNLEDKEVEEEVLVLEEEDEAAAQESCQGEATQRYKRQCASFQALRPLIQQLRKQYERQCSQFFALSHVNQVLECLLEKRVSSGCFNAVFTDAADYLGLMLPTLPPMVQELCNKLIAVSQARTSIPQLDTSAEQQLVPDESLMKMQSLALEAKNTVKVSSYHDMYTGTSR
eukprot:m.201771 g.201771  ORF g.201771 m.201771 type:complete len:194 (-) comp14969_c0_seq5:1993-2574(-)